MKYIRTRNNIYELEMAKEYGIEDLAIDQADTINKLIDTYILVKDDGDVSVNSHLDMLQASINFVNRLRKSVGDKPYKYVIYGAIWTDKGLIYVAKMNEKGELELL